MNDKVMLKELSLKNFQSHKDTKMEFVPGVNVILGASDSGKTAVLRALRWVIRNKPGGDAFRSTWGGDTAVSVSTEDGSVTRRKGTNENSYKLEKQMPAIFTAFGSDVPEPIRAFFNIDEVNLQQQLDAPFLLSETPGQVAAYFNRVAGIDVIDTAMTNVKREIASISQTIKSTKEDVLSKKASLEKYADLDVMEVLVEEVEQLEKTRNKKSNLRQNLSSIVTRIDKVQTTISELAPLLAYEKQVNDLLEKIKQKSKKSNETKKLNLVIQKISKTDDSLDEMQQLLGIEQTVVNLLAKIGQRQQEKAVLNRFSLLVGKCTGITKNVQKTHENLIAKQKLFEEHLTVCPLCGTNLKKQKS
jgi:exonuclease SbcC